MYPSIFSAKRNIVWNREFIGSDSLNYFLKVLEKRFYTPEIGMNAINIGERKVGGDFWFLITCISFNCNCHGKIILNFKDKIAKIIITVHCLWKYSDIMRLLSRDGPL